jgi:hypothetical protein
MAELSRAAQKNSDFSGWTAFPSGDYIACDMPIFPRKLLLIFGLLLTLTGGASAQVLVYKLFFETTGETLNYDFYDGGYFVCEAPRGDGTFILTVKAIDHKRYYTTATGGSLFYIHDRRKYLAVLTADGGTDGANATYQATGDIDGSTKIGGSIRMPIARSLDGYLVASQETGDPVVDDSNDGQNRTDGFAGYSRMKVRLDSGRTKDYNNDMLTQGEAVDAITKYLRDRGYNEETTTTTTASGSTEETEDTGTTP